MQIIEASVLVFAFYILSNSNAFLHSCFKFDKNKKIATEKHDFVYIWLAINPQSNVFADNFLLNDKLHLEEMIKKQKISAIFDMYKSFKEIGAFKAVEHDIGQKSKACNY